MEGLQFIYNASNLPFMTRLPKNRGITRVAGAKSLTTHLSKWTQTGYAERERRFVLLLWEASANTQKNIKHTHSFASKKAKMNTHYARGVDVVK